MLWLVDPPDVRSALIGVIGVIIGGLLTGTASYLMERERTRRDVEAHDRKARDEMRRAARLLRNQLEQVVTALASARDGSYRQEEHRLLTGSLELWREFRGALAMTADEQAWETTAIAFQEINRLALRLGRRLDGAMSTTVDEALVQPAIQAATKGKNALTDPEPTNSPATRRSARTASRRRRTAAEGSRGRTPGGIG